MNARRTASGATAAVVPGAIIVGVGLLVSSVAGLRADRDHYRAVAGRPRPATTVTVPPAAPVPGAARTTAVARPSASPTPAAAVQPVSDPGTTMPHNDDGNLSHTAARPPSTPEPSPAAAPCSGQALSVRLRAACVSIEGGS